MRSERARAICSPPMIWVIGITEVLLARIVATAHGLDVGEQLLLQRAGPRRRLDHIIGFGHGVGEIVTGCTRSNAVTSSSRSRKLAAMRTRTLSRPP